ncbi:hypothetical protein [Staphylococcus saprophyticus]|uniref:hypothetical protein n=1 Tax=Staphylococcus saprophyticus TaxID=29385 RepID=UPI0016434DD0|nr:hypothetical protein [Staphylococcus saprophyticus]
MMVGYVGVVKDVKLIVWIIYLVVFVGEEMDESGDIDMEECKEEERGEVNVRIHVF